VDDLQQALETRRLLLEPLVAQHAAALFEALQATELYVFIPQDPPASLQRLEERYLALASRTSPDGQEMWLNWVMRQRATGAYVGMVEASVHADRTATLAYMVFPPFWRQGFAKEACGRVVASLFDEYRVSRIAAEIDTRNAASVHLVEALGFARATVTSGADFFKGSLSDEYRYERSAPEPAGT